MKHISSGWNHNNLISDAKMLLPVKFSQLLLLHMK